MVKRWVPYLSDGRLTLFPGEVVSLTLSDAGPVVTAATVLTAEDRDPAIEAAVAAVQKKTEALGEEQVAPAPKASTDAFVVDKDSLRIVFVQTAMGDMMLRVGNGYDRLLSYHAFITKPGAASAPTSVCAVLAKISSVESWAPPILAIDLGDFQLQPNGTAADCR
jgi:2',3'-cyclic-nucleotide 2'-phosphodiesterase (5'-nucleotidase family)